MDWLWPEFLVFLVIIPLLIALYIWILRRRKRFAVRFSSLALVRAALPDRNRLRRHLPFAMFLVALASLIIALGRPVTIASMPISQTTIIMTIDVSRSMRFNDIQPSRLAAAQSAALSFIHHQNGSAQIGIVAFSGYAQLILPPTNDQASLEAAIQSLTTGRSTAIGSGLLKSLDAISQVDPNIAPSITDPSQGTEPSPPPKDSYAPDIVVLLTDGVSNTGPAPLDAAQQAVDRGIRVFTIGFGTTNGPSGGDFFGGGFGGPPPQGSQNNGNQQSYGQGYGGFRRGIDEVTLRKMAQMTGGQYFGASSADDLEAVFQNLPTKLVTRRETTEFSVIFAGVGALFAALAVGLSLIWHPLP